MRDPDTLAEHGSQPWVNPALDFWTPRAFLL